MTRRYWRWIARGLLFAFLFAQGAVSVYACAGVGQAPEARTVIEAMPDCDMMQGLDPAAANLCMVHCLSDQLTLDHHWKPGAESGPVAVLIVTSVDPAISTSSLRTADARLFTAAAPPPHAILHCCFRI